MQAAQRGSRTMKFQAKTNKMYKRIYSLLESQLLLKMSENEGLYSFKNLNYFLLSIHTCSLRCERAKSILEWWQDVSDEEGDVIV